MFSTWLNTDGRNTANATSGVYRDNFWPEALSSLTKYLVKCQAPRFIMLLCSQIFPGPREISWFFLAIQLQGCLTNTPELCLGDHHQLLRRHASLSPVPFIRQMFLCIQHHQIMLQAGHIPVVDNLFVNTPFLLPNLPVEWILGYSVA